MKVTVSMISGAQHVFDSEPRYYAGLGIVQFSKSYKGKLTVTEFPLCNVERIEIEHGQA